MAPGKRKQQQAVPSPSDEQLWLEYLEGQPDRFEALVERHSRELYQFLVRFVGDAAAAEDLVQEAFLQAHLAASTFERGRRFKPWLFTIAANKARDLLRARARRPEMPLDAAIRRDMEEGRRFADFLADPSPGPEAPLDEQERSRRVREVISAMPEHLREVLILSYYHRFPYKEIAEILGVPLGTVKSRLHAAVTRFAEAYKASLKASGVES